jgi:type VI secretion system protein ImpF
MNREPERTVSQSLLDRLTDDSAKGLGDRVMSFSESVRRYKAGVLRDLEWLLNTRRIYEPLPEGCEELEKSVYYYGLPDTTSLSGDDPAVRRMLQRDITDCIRRFEPRLTDVEVKLVPATDERRLLRFTVEAILRMDPDPERVLFDTMLDPSNGRVHVASDGHAR